MHDYIQIQWNRRLYIRIISKLQCKRNLLTCWFWSLVLTRSRGNTHETPIIPAIPPFTILGTMENVFCWGLLDTSLTSVLPDIVTDETLSVAAAAEIPVDIDGIKWQFCNMSYLLYSMPIRFGFFILIHKLAYYMTLKCAIYLRSFCWLYSYGSRAISHTWCNASILYHNIGIKISLSIILIWVH